MTVRLKVGTKALLRQAKATKKYRKHSLMRREFAATIRKNRMGTAYREGSTKPYRKKVIGSILTKDVTPYR